MQGELAQFSFLTKEFLIKSQCFQRSLFVSAKEHGKGSKLQPSKILLWPIQIINTVDKTIL